jgi:hypothetical protein
VRLACVGLGLGGQPITVDLAPLERAVSCTLPSHLRIGCSAGESATLPCASGHAYLMSLEWVAPVATAGVGVAGVFFTWLSGRQTRKQAAEMDSLSYRQAERQRVREEQREAYLAVLRLAYVNSYRQKYERRGDLTHLNEVDERWPRAERLRMLVEGDIALEIYGSEEARRVLAEWTSLDDPHEDGAYLRFFQQFITICQHDLGIVDPASRVSVEQAV